MERQPQRQKQIPCGDDNKNSNSNGKGKREGPGLKPLFVGGLIQWAEAHCSLLNGNGNGNGNGNRNRNSNGNGAHAEGAEKGAQRAPRGAWPGGATAVKLTG